MHGPIKVNPVLCKWATLCSFCRTSQWLVCQVQRIHMLGFYFRGSSDIRFNLMAVVADRRLAYDQKLSTLRANKQVILDALEQVSKIL